MPNFESEVFTSDVLCLVGSGLEPRTPACKEEVPTTKLPCLSSRHIFIHGVKTKMFVHQLDRAGKF